MIPEKGQYVKCLLVNGTIIEGIVETWNMYAAFSESANKMIGVVELKSIDDKSIIIIRHPDENILVVKISLEEVKVEAPRTQIQKIKDKIIRKSKTEQIFEQKVAEPSNPYDATRNKSLAELKIELAKQEKEIVASKLKDHYLGDVRKVEYGGYPRISKKPGTK